MRQSTGEPRRRASDLGQWVHASVSIPPVSDCLDGTFRIYRAHRTDLTDLVDLAAINPQAANVLAAFERTSTGVLITGGPGSGKSTIASAMLHATPATTIVRIVQEVRETRRSTPSRRSMVARGGRPLHSVAGAARPAVRSAAPGRRRNTRGRGVRVAQGRQRGLRVPDHPAAGDIRRSSACSRSSPQRSWPARTCPSASCG